MDSETLTRMGAEFGELIKSWESGAFCEVVSIESCIKKMGIRLNSVYGTAIIPDRFEAYAMAALIWSDRKGGFLSKGVGLGILAHTVARAIKEVCHDILSGKEAPKAVEFMEILDRVYK